MSKYVDRLRADYRKTFGTAAGKHVLMDLYKNCHGMRSTFPRSGQSLELALNEGKRWVLLYIVDKLKENDEDLRKLWQLDVQETIRRESK